VATAHSRGCSRTRPRSQRLSRHDSRGIAAPESLNAETRCEQVRFSNAKFDLFTKGNIARLNGSIPGNFPTNQFSYHKSDGMIGRKIGW
jgi:hypothetical protein